MSIQWKLCASLAVLFKLTSLQGCWGSSRPVHAPYDPPSRDYAREEAMQRNIRALSDQLSEMRTQNAQLNQAFQSFGQKEAELNRAFKQKEAELNESFSEREKELKKKDWVVLSFTFFPTPFGKDYPI